MVDAVIMHPSDGKAWKNFNMVYPQFLMELWNIHLRLCTDKFNPFRSFATPYSCRSVILTIYNLSSKMFMRPKFMFLSMVIFSPNSQGININVCFQPLVDE